MPTEDTPTLKLLKVLNKMFVILTCHPGILLVTIADGMMLDLEDTAPADGTIPTSLLLNNAAPALVEA